MPDDNHDLRVSARTARLTAGFDGDGARDPPYRFGGIAVAAGDILHMDDGTRVLMTEAELRKAAETQAGEPLTKDHPEDDNGRPKYPPEVDETFGKVQKAGWVESQKGVGYEATTHDEAIASGVQGGSLDVSVHPFFDVEPYDGPEADVVATNIRFGDLSAVSKGDSPNNTAEWGPNQALASWTASADIGAELTAAAGGDPGGDADGDRQGLIASTVRGTLQALGIQPEEVPADGGGGDGSGSIDGGDEPGGNPGADGGSGSSGSTPMDDRDDVIGTLSDDHDFDEEWLEDQEDDVLEQLRESVVGSGDGTDTGTDTSGGGSNAGADTNGGGSGGTTLAEMTVEELGDSLREQGFVTEENAGDLVEEAQAQASKREKVEEIIAKSDEFDEDDREELLASATKIVDREYKRVRGELAASLPGTAGAAAQLTAQGGASDDALDDYGTGVAGADEGGDGS